MKTNYGPVYLILATMAVAAMAIGAEPVRHNKKLELSKAEAGKPAQELVLEAPDTRLPGTRVIVIDSSDFDASLSAGIATAIATAKARKRTG